MADSKPGPARAVVGNEAGGVRSRFRVRVVQLRLPQWPIRNRDRLVPSHAAAKVEGGAGLNPGSCNWGFPNGRPESVIVQCRRRKNEVSVGGADRRARVVQLGLP